VGEPSLDDPKRTWRPISPSRTSRSSTAVNAGKPALRRPAIAPTGVNEPPRSDQPSQAPLQLEGSGGRNRRRRADCQRAQRSPAADPNAVVKPWARRAPPARRRKAGRGPRSGQRRQARIDSPAQMATQEEEAQDRPERRILQQEEKEEGAGQAEPVLGSVLMNFDKKAKGRRWRPFALA
jgi:hypothetical protein